MKATLRNTQGPSYVEVAEETNTDVEIVEEGEEGETAGPIPATVKKAVLIDSCYLLHWVIPHHRSGSRQVC